MTETLSPAMAFGCEGSCPPQATISLSQTHLMTPEPTSPESYYSIKEECLEGEDQKKPTKKRKSWGQELPTPKTNLPPRYIFPRSRSLASLTSSSENEQRPRMKKSNVASSESFEIVKPLNHHASARDKKWRSSRAKRCLSNNRTKYSKNN